MATIIIKHNKPKRQLIQTGQIYMNGGDFYLLVLIPQSGNVTLINMFNMQNGNMWSDAVMTKNPKDITEGEFKALCGVYRSGFVLFEGSLTLENKIAYAE